MTIECPKSQNDNPDNQKFCGEIMPPSPAPSETEAAQQPPVGRASAIILGIAAVQILVLIIAATNSNYGYFLDELYFLACSDHLA